MIVLRAPRAEDAPRLARIMGDWVRSADYLPNLHSREDDEAHVAGLIASDRVTVAEHDDIVAGFAATDGPWLSHLYLHENHRSHGIGSRLLEHVKEDARSLDLWCFQANSGARRFYERHGFGVVKMTDGAGNEENAPDIHYRWERQT